MEALGQKIDKLVQSNEKIQQVVDTTLAILNQHTENQKLFEKKLDIIENKVSRKEEFDRMKNLIIFGVDESKESSVMLLNKVMNVFTKVGISIPEVVYSDAYRIGKRAEGKCRPICIKFIAERWKHIVFEKSSHLSKLGYKVDSDYNKKDRVLINKILKARYVLRQRDKFPIKKGLTLWLDNKKLSEEDLDTIISTQRNDSEVNEDSDRHSSIKSQKTDYSSQQSSSKSDVLVAQKKKDSLAQSTLSKFAYQDSSGGVVTRKAAKAK